MTNMAVMTLAELALVALKAFEAWPPRIAIRVRLRFDLTRRDYNMSLTFVHYRDSCHRALSPTSRRNVLQVSRRAGARTRAGKGPAKKVNLLQMPELLVSYTQPVEVEASTHPSSQQPLQVKLNSAESFKDAAHTDGNTLVYFAPVAIPPLMSAPCMSVDWLQLLVLASPNLAEILIKHTAALEAKLNPRRWLRLGRLTDHHVLAVLLQHHGQREYLDLAIECVGARIQQFLLEGTSRRMYQREIRQKYLSALQSLQIALASASEFDWRLWQTTLLLNLFEVRPKSRSHPVICLSKTAS